MTASSDFLQIDTPENVAFGYPIAGIGSRFLAAVVDTLIIVVLQVIIFGTIYLVASLLLDDISGPWLIALGGLLGFVFLWGYYIFFEMIWNGQSPGKRWIGMRVIRLDGTPITLSESIIRNLVRLVDFLPSFYGVGVVTMFIDGQDRRLGDLAASTLVVIDRSTITLASLSARPSPIGVTISAADTDGYPVERLTDLDVAMAEDFLLRRYSLSDSDATARQVAAALLARMALSPEQAGDKSPERIIREVVQARRRDAQA